MPSLLHDAETAAVAPAVGDWEVLSSVAQLVGETPVVELGRLAAGLPGRIVVKLEGRNPGGSSKDRAALGIIRSAEASGALAPGATIVESSSGNTGIGLALIGRLTGHPVVIVHSADISAEKKALLRAYGARLVEADWDAAPDDAANPRAVAAALTAEIPGAWQSRQFDNADNPNAHFTATGPELWRQTAARVTHFVAAIGTGGTISGVGGFLKQASNGAVRVIGANPVGSTYGGGAEGPILVDGVGTRWSRDWWPANVHAAVIDEVRTIPDRRVYDTLHALALEEGLLLGPSSALAVATALEIAADAAPGSVIAVISADSGLNYLTKGFNADWLHAAGLTGTDA
ncbi:cysteine synthase family protein [Rathayibacter sp. YIM 133350]|uniref:PLP-dependent cysteine synthase family protein n=1 Tax=Rathayibacter sp. YIM 133350 TaxID=3131992 RepID=UPI00307E7866